MIGELRETGRWKASLTWLRRVLLPGRFPGLDLPEGLSVSEDEAMLAERVKEWPQLTRPDAFERIAEWVINARDAEDFLPPCQGNRPPHACEGRERQRAWAGGLVTGQGVLEPRLGRATRWRVVQNCTILVR